ncbi:MAG: hypothetical protein ACYS0G_01880 [Planctomycetota bacterium]|jgi:hypothetical protein
MTSRVLAASTAGVVVALTAGIAFADEPALPEVMLEWKVNGGSGYEYNWNQHGELMPYAEYYVGESGPWTGWKYLGDDTDNGFPGGDFSFEWTTVFSPGTGGAAAQGGGAFVIANIGVINNDPLNTQNFQLLMTMPVFPAIIDPLKNGSIVGTVTDLDDDGALVSAPLGASIYTAFIDGFQESLLMTDPFGASPPQGGSTPVGPQDFGVPNPIPASRDVTTDIAILLNFDLSPSDAATFTAIFEVIPGPGGLPLLAAFGLLAGRRRRRT